jgi:3-oxoacyl-[acyl-carrier-protein] synthase-3
MSASLYAIAISEPNLAAVAALRTEPRARAVDILLSDGLDTYAQSRVGVADMAFEAASRALARSGLDPTAIDVVVIVTESFWDNDGVLEGGREYAQFRDGLLKRLLLDLKLTNAYACGSWSGACGNFIPSLGLAQALVATGQARSVLLVVADRLQPGSARLMSSGTTVRSDVAAAGIVGAGGSMHIEHVVVDPSASILSSRTERNFLLHAKNLRQALRHLDRRTHAVTGRPLREFDFLVAEGFSEAIIRLLCDCAGITRDKVLCPGRRRFSHPFSADILVSLGLLEANRMTPGTRFAAVSLSTWLLAAATFHVG